MPTDLKVMLPVTVVKGAALVMLVGLILTVGGPFPVLKALGAYLMGIVLGITLSLRLVVPRCSPEEGAPEVPAAPIESMDDAFEKWWNDHGQYCRSGGGNYEKTFAYAAYQVHFPHVDKLPEVLRCAEKQQ